MRHKDALQSASLGFEGGGARGNQEAIDFQTIRRFIRKRWRLCLTWLVSGLLLGTAYAIASPPSYTATAAVLLEDPTARNNSGDAVAQSDAAHSTYVETQLQVFASDEVIGRVVNSLKLIDDPEFGRNAGALRTWLIKQLRQLLGSAQTPRHEPRYATIVRLRHALTVHRVGLSDVLEIQFTSRNSARSAEFADAVIENYTKSRLAVQQSTRAESAAHIRTLLAEVRDKAFPPIPPGEAAAAETPPGAGARAHFLEEQEKIDTYRTVYGMLLKRAVGDVKSQYQELEYSGYHSPDPTLDRGFATDDRDRLQRHCRRARTGARAAAGSNRRYVTHPGRRAKSRRCRPRRCRSPPRRGRAGRWASITAPCATVLRRAVPACP